MGNKVDILHIPCTNTGFNYIRNLELLSNTALITPTCNININEKGVGKRGGTAKTFTGTVLNRIMGGYDFRKSTGSQEMLYAKNNGSVYSNNDSNVLVTGMSVSNFFHFSQYYDDAYIADGATIPKKYSGGVITPVIPASSWASTGYPFQIIFHPRGASFRNWAITKDGVYASESGFGDNFDDTDVKYIQVFSKGGLIGAIEFGQELFVFSKTETFRIDDSSDDPADWGYQKAIWEGGASHWRLMCVADNDVYIMADDLTIYSLQGVFATGDYRKASVSDPAKIDRYLRENASFSNVENWHCAYDPNLRCIKWFVQVGGTQTNTALVQFIDEEPLVMWTVHNNLNYDSGYTASCSFTFRKGVGDWRIRTGAFTGDMWELEQSSKNDNANPITSAVKFKNWDFGNAVMHKFFQKIILRIRSTTNLSMTAYVWVNGIRIPDITVSASSSGAMFDSSSFDSAFFADDFGGKAPFAVRSFGEQLQLQLIHENEDEDFFLSEVLVAFKECGIRMTV